MSHATAAGEGWPPLDYERLQWHSRAASFDPRAARGESYREGFYLAAVPAFIADRSISLDPDVASLAEDATDALIRFDAALGGEIAPFASILLRGEAAASSQIEHLTASARSILTAELTGTSGVRNAKVVAANTAAMNAALSLADDVSVQSVLAMHRALMEGDPHHAAGQWREEPVWIGHSGLSPLDASYVAPRYERVPALMDDLIVFARRFDLPRLAQIAVAHAQCETIHPFTDGNGRTGRALLQSLLRYQRVTRNVTVPVSAGLLADTRGYVAALTAFRSGNIDEIVEATSHASFLAVENATTLVDEIRSARIRWAEVVRPRRGSLAARALDVIARAPVMTAQSFASEMDVTVTHVYPALNKLTEAGILKAKAEYKVGTVWRCDDILAALDTFAARAARRR